jgi:hypothetical protein
MQIGGATPATFSILGFCGLEDCSNLSQQHFDIYNMKPLHGLKAALFNTVTHIHTKWNFEC